MQLTCKNHLINNVLKIISFTYKFVTSHHLVSGVFGALTFGGQASSAVLKEYLDGKLFSICSVTLSV
jgi:hypothetical protein